MWGKMKGGVVYKVMVEGGRGEVPGGRRGGGGAEGEL